MYACCLPSGYNQKPTRASSHAECDLGSVSIHTVSDQTITSQSSVASGKHLSYLCVLYIYLYCVVAVVVEFYIPSFSATACSLEGWSLSQPSLVEKQGTPWTASQYFTWLFLFYLKKEKFVFLGYTAETFSKQTELKSIFPKCVQRSVTYSCRQI